MTNENVNEALALLTDKPLKSVTFERFLILNEIKNKYDGLPQPEIFGNMLTELLSRVSVPVEKYDLILGRAPDRLLTDEEEAEFEKYARSPYNPVHRSMLGAGHCTYGWEYIVENGLPGLIEKAEESLAGREDPEERSFLKGAIMIYKAIQLYLDRYSRSAMEIGLTEAAEACYDAAYKKPCGFRQMLQLVWTVGFINNSYLNKNPTLTLGRMDRFLYKFYIEDIGSGRLTRKLAAGLITDFYCKNNLNMGRGEHQMGDETNSTTWDRIYNFDAPQYLPLGGSDREGNDASNELTELFLECIVPKFKNPVIVFRYTPGFAKRRPHLWKIIAGKQLQSASLMIYNDHDVISALRYEGIPEDAAIEYDHFGCNWASVGENSNWMHDWPDSRLFYPEMPEDEKKAHYRPYDGAQSQSAAWPVTFRTITEELYKEKGASVTPDDIFRGFFENVGKRMDMRLAYAASELKYRNKHPAAIMKYSDPFFRRSIERAACNSASGCDYHFFQFSFSMLGSVVDSYIVVDELVYKRKLLSLGRLLEAVGNNFEGYEYELALCRSVDKFGSNTESSNAVVRRFCDTFVDLIRKKNAKYLAECGVCLNPALETDTGNIRNGMICGATLDGRRAGEAFSQNSNPSPGSCTGGLSEMLGAMLSIPFDKFTSGANNVSVDPKDFPGERGISDFAGLMGSYFERGGLHAQVSAVSVDEMLDAQVNPQAHKDLRVRVTGYSGVFVDITKTLQDEIIKRSI